jgi:hypothetical protein
MKEKERLYRYTQNVPKGKKAFNTFADVVTCYKKPDNHVLVNKATTVNKYYMHKVIRIKGHNKKQIAFESQGRQMRKAQ